MTILIVPALWTALEFIRAHLFTGFPWLFLGHSQFGSISLIQLSSILGEFGITFLIVVVNRAVYEFIISFGIQGIKGKRIKDKGKNKSESGGLIKNAIQCCMIILIMGGVIYWGNNRIIIYDAETEDSPRVTLSIIQGNIPQEQKWDPVFKDDIINKYTRLSEELYKDNPDLIVWPEAAVPVYMRHDKEVKNKICDFVQKGGIPLVTGDPDVKELPDETLIYYNSAFMISKNGLIMDTYNKIKLVPFGEYIPGLIRKMMPFIGTITETEEDFTPGNEYTIFYLNNVPFAVTICFEAIFPGLLKKFVVRGARFILNITNDAWFGKTAQPVQDMALNVFSAVCNGIPIVRSTNTGVSCFIDGVGRIKSVLHDASGEQLFIEGTLTDTIPITDFRTLYLKIGDIFSILCIIFIVILLWIRRDKRRQY